jgi:hypothetical protein
MNPKIPTKLTGPLIAEIINGRRCHVYQTDAGPLTGEQIKELTGIEPHKILSMYRDGITDFGAFSDEAARARVELLKGKIPTYIKHYDTKLMVAEGADGFRRLRCYLTDVGWMSVREMFKATGRNPRTIDTRIHRQKPGNKEIFNEKMTNQRTANHRMESRLSDRPRNHNLSKIKIGTWEAQQNERSDER